MKTNSTYHISNVQEKEINNILEDAMKNSLLNSNNKRASFNKYKTNPYNNYNKLNSFSTKQNKSINTLNRENNVSNFYTNKSNNFNINRSISNNNSLINNDNNNLMNSNSRFTYCIESEDSDEKPRKRRKKTKSSIKVKHIVKNDDIDYQEEYEKVRKELEKYKNQLVQERIKENMLKRQVGIKSKKEGELKALDSKKKKLKDKSNEILYKLERSEKLRNEQKCVLNELINEYNMLLNILKSNPDVEITSKLSELENEEKKMNNQSL